MEKRLESALARIRRMRTATREIAERSAALRSELQTALLDLGDLARRSLRRRRYGDGRA